MGEPVMANPWERNWATPDTAAAAAVAAAPSETSSSLAPWERNWATEATPKAPTNSATDSAIDEIRARQKAAQEDHPVAFGAGQVGGSLIPASKVMKVAGTGASLGSAVVRSGIAGGVLGAIEGFG